MRRLTAGLLTGSQLTWVLACDLDLAVDAWLRVDRGWHLLRCLALDVGLSRLLLLCLRLLFRLILDLCE